MSVVCLKNGASENDRVVRVVMVSLRELAGTVPGLLALYELDQLSMNRDHAIWSEVQFDLLARLALVGGTFRAPSLHDTIRNVVRSSVRFEGATLVLDPPVAA